MAGGGSGGRSFDFVCEPYACCLTPDAWVGRPSVGGVRGQETRAQLTGAGSGDPRTAFGPRTPFGPRSGDAFECCDCCAVGEVGCSVDGCVGADLAVVADGDRAADCGEGVDRGVAADLGAGVDVCLCRVDDRGALKHQGLHGGVLDAAMHLGQLIAAVDAQSFFDGQPVGGDDALAIRQHDGGGVGQVEFALLVVGVDVFQGSEESLIVEDVASDVDFGDCFLSSVGVFFFDDALEFTVGIADDAAEAEVVFGDSGADHAGGFFVFIVLEQGGKRTALHQRRVAGEDHGRAVVLAEVFFANHHRMPGAVLFRLQGEFDILVHRERGFDLLCFMTHDNDQPLDTGGTGGIEDVFDHRPAAQWVQDLRRRRFHTGAFSGSEDDGDGGGGHGVALY